MDTLEQRRVEVVARLAEHGITDADVRVAEDPYGGWRLLVVAAGFEAYGGRQRRRIALGESAPEDLQWSDFVTPSELDPQVEDRLFDRVEDLPLWSNMLASRLDPAREILLPSDFDEPLPAPFVTTFFSLRGGVGRSTALAMAARILARQGHCVLCIDMDLEAPGLGALFGVEEALAPDKGTLALLLELDMMGDADLVRHLVKVSDRDELYCLPAGIPSADYARKLSLIDTPSWYEEESNPLRLLLELATASSIAPDFVLLDARTGISPLNAPLLFDLSDMVVVTFFPHPQSMRGTEALTRALFLARTRREGKTFAPEPRFIISPVPPSRTPSLSEYWEQIGKDAIASWILPFNELRKPKHQQLDVEELVHVVPYQESIANSERLADDPSVTPFFEPIANWIEGFLPAKAEPLAAAEAPRPSKNEVLPSLHFSTGIAEAQEPEQFLNTFLKTGLVERALDPAVPLVIGRKGTGKSAIFRYLQQTNASSAIGLAARGAARPAWLPDSQAFDAIERDLKAVGTSWTTMWLLQTGAAVADLVKSDIPVPSGPSPTSAWWAGDAGTSYAAHVRWMRAALAVEDAALQARTWLAQIDELLEDDVLVLFDGLDTEFGPSDDDRRRRRAAVGELLSVVDQAQTLHQIKFKVLLREDIWRSVTLPNKTHFYGRSVSLAWDDQIEYLKVVLKQALRSAAFTRYVGSRLPTPVRALLDAGVEIDQWPSDASLALWRLLAGERVSGSNTAFTHRWVWNRLADGTGGHAPRPLLQLFDLARSREIERQRVSEYSGSLIRPRALADSLAEVSEQALDALREEFQELEPMFQRLRAVGRTPFRVEDFGTDRDLELEKLAIDVGLLSASADDPNEVDRYRVPDLYRWSLNMTRRGQA